MKANLDWFRLLVFLLLGFALVSCTVEPLSEPLRASPVVVVTATDVVVPEMLEPEDAESEDGETDENLPTFGFIPNLAIACSTEDTVHIYGSGQLAGTVTGCEDPTVSQDLKWAVCSDGANLFAISLPTDGSTLIPLGTGFAPAFSPSGTQLAFVDYDPASNTPQVITAPFSEGQLGPRTQLTTENGMDPAWDTNGEVIYFSTVSTVAPNPQLRKSIAAKNTATGAVTVIMAGSPDDDFTEPASYMGLVLFSHMYGKELTVTVELSNDEVVAGDIVDYTHMANSPQCPYGSELCLFNYLLNDGTTALAAKNMVTGEIMFLIEPSYEPCMRAWGVVTTK